MATEIQKPKTTTEFFKISYKEPLATNIQITPACQSAIEKWRASISKSFDFKNQLKAHINSENNAKLDSNGNSENGEGDHFVQLGEETSSIVKDLIAQSESIERVTKASIFEEEITEREMDIIKQRVALQQKQFAEFEKREFAVKSKKILGIFEHLSRQEIEMALESAKNNEDEAIIKLSDPAFMQEIRKNIAHQHESTTTAVNNAMTEFQRHQYEELVKKRTKTQKKTTTEEVKRKYHTVGRLPLDKALEQLRQHAAANGDDSSKGKHINLESAMQGWSLARIKAYKAIKTKPNTYYYRFNAPGEVQRVGGWSESEKKLFHARLAEIGANGQWGIFSMAIPGRVGYQCSNYYRFLIENNKIKDPNYVLDSKGKAHYLFATKRKNADGTVVKEFRSHNKRPKGTSKKRTYAQTSEESEVLFESEEESGPEITIGSSKRNKKPSRGYGYSNESDSDDEIRANDVELTSDDEAEFSMDNGSRNRSSVSARSTRSRQNLYASDSGRSSAIEQNAYSSRKISRGSSGVHIARNSSNNCFSDLISSPKNSDDENEAEAENYNPNNPLPDFLDPITLEKVSKPAISPYGHVMNYDSWIRCLMFPNEGGQRNICPLTKKPLTKRELVILTFDNIEEYRPKIVNM